MRALLCLWIAAHLLVACGGAAHEANHASRDEAMQPQIPPFVEPAPVDPDVAALPEVNAGWIDARDGGRTYVLEAGPRDSRQTPLVLVHGLGERGVIDFYPVLPTLSASRRVIAIDLPGLGRSTLGSAQPSPATFVTRVLEVVAERAPAGFDLVGHSLGGVVALMVAAQAPTSVRRLSLIDVAGVLHREAFVGNQLHQALDPLHRVSPRAGELIEGAGKAVVSFLRRFEPGDALLSEGAQAWTGPQAQAALALIQVDAGPHLDRVVAPTLIVWGERDPIAPLRTAAVLNARIVHSRLLVLPNVGHVPMQEATAALTDALDAFLSASEHDVSRDTATSTAATGMTETPPAADWRCDGLHDQVIEGRYRTLQLRDCQRAVLKNVHAETLISEHSSGSLHNVTITRGMQATDSDWTITAGRLNGDVALTLSNSRIDIAGTRVHGTQAAIRATTPSRVLMSVVDLRSPRTQTSGHGDTQLHANEGY